MQEDKSEFDFSGYLDNSPHHNVENKNKNRKIKDEMGGVLIQKLTRLRGKMYSVLSIDL